MVVRVGLTLTLSLLLGACYTGAPLSHFVGILDELHPPASWQVVTTRTNGPDSGNDHTCSPITDAGCPSAVRFFFVTGDARTMLTDAEQVVADAGFRVDHELTSDCRGTPTGPACAFLATRGTDKVWGYVYRSAVDAGLTDQSGTQMTILISAAH
jgi:hypothetical protein